MRIPELDLPAGFAEALEKVSKRDGWKVLYIRRPGSTGQNVYWWNLETRQCMVTRINGDWRAGFQVAKWQHPQDIGLGTPQVLVCTHGSRDRCCGVLGGAIFAQLKNQLRPILPDAVWQVSHLGGHRFAPTALCLPLGLLLGRVEAQDVSTIAQAVMMNSASSLRTEIIRGDVRLSKMEQARALWLRKQQGQLEQVGETDFTWTSGAGMTHTTTQCKVELGEMAASCGDTKTKMMYRWAFQTQ